MSVLSISRKPRERENSGLSNPVNALDAAPEKLDSTTISSTLRKTYPKIPADCYRNGAASVIQPCNLVTLVGKSLLRWWDCDTEVWGKSVGARVRPPFTVVICWIPAGCFNGDEWLARSASRPVLKVAAPHRLRQSEANKGFYLSQDKAAMRANPAITFKAACRNTGRRLSTFGRNPNPAGWLPGELLAL